jgi:hypothetical protein
MKRAGLMKRSAIVFIAISLLIFQSACGSFDPRTIRSGERAKTAPHFEPGFNLFSPEQDIQIGRQSAQQVVSQVPLLRDEQTVKYIQQIGAKLAAKAGGNKFPYQFNVIAVKDINAFALPGGFIFVNAGVILAAKNEGEIAGVMAHEIAHVALRHGTNQASKAYVAKAGLDVIGAITGGNSTDIGQIINAIGGAGANVVFLKMSRTAETEADLDGARIMAEAGYDPRDMANFFKTLQSEHGSEGPEFLSDHPDPGNRIEAINGVVSSLPLSKNPVRITPEFEQVKARLASRNLNSSAEMSRLGPGGGGRGSRPAPPDETFAHFESRDKSFAVDYPGNWDALKVDDANMIFAPRGAYGRMNESVMVTHGIFIGAVPAQADELEEATRIFVEQQLKANPDFQIQGQIKQIDFGDAKGYAAIMAGPSPVTGVTEIDVIYTTATEDGRLFYLITIAPQDEYDNYRNVFERIIEAIRLG